MSDTKPLAPAGRIDPPTTFIGAVAGIAGALGLADRLGLTADEILFVGGCLVTAGASIRSWGPKFASWLGEVIRNFRRALKGE